jgi:hypothetical protein
MQAAQADAMVEWLRATLVRPRDARLQAMLERKRALWCRLGVDVERAQANHELLASELGMSKRQVRLCVWGPADDAALMGADPEMAAAREVSAVCLPCAAPAAAASRWRFSVLKLQHCAQSESGLCNRHSLVSNLLCAFALQMLSCWRFELRQGNSRTMLCTEASQAFCTRLERHVTALERFAFGRADVAALAAHNFQPICSDARELAAKIEARRVYFAPHGDAPVAKLPAALSHRSRASTPQLVAAVVCGPANFLNAGLERVQEYLNNMVALQLFASERDARAACMRSPRLLRTRSWSGLVRITAAVRCTGGTDDDVLLAVACNVGWVSVLQACMLRTFLRCEGSHLQCNVF